MRTALRTIVVFGGLLALVAGLSLIYTRWVGPRPAHPGMDSSRPFDVETAAEEPTESPAIRKGIDALNENRLDEAFERFSAILEKDPGYVVALQHLAEIERRRGNLEDSLTLMLEVARRQPDNPVAQLGLAGAQYRVQRFAEAERSVLLAIELDPENALARYNVALIRTALGDLEQAVRSYARAMAIDRGRERILQALSDLERLSNADPQAPVPHYAMAYFAGRLGDVSTEADELRHFLEWMPEGPAADLARQKLADIEARLSTH